MLMIRLKREGKKHQATMRIVVVDSKKSAISNRYVEKIGWWIPSQHKNEINKERAQYWISMGAKMSATVNNLFVTEGVIEGTKIPKHKLHAFKAQPEVAEVATPAAPKEEPKEKEEVKEEVATEEVKVEEVAAEEVEEVAVEEAPVEESKGEAATEEVTTEETKVEEVVTEEIKKTEEAPSEEPAKTE